MSRDKYNMLQYTVALVSEFSAHFGISQQQALNYLVRFKGLAIWRSSTISCIHILSTTASTHSQRFAEITEGGYDNAL